VFQLVGWIALARMNRGEGTPRGADRPLHVGRSGVRCLSGHFLVRWVHVVIDRAVGRAGEQAVDEHGMVIQVHRRSFGSAK
jgi:hypothetical protein